MLLPALLGAITVIMVLRKGHSLGRHLIALILGFMVIFATGYVSFVLAYPFNVPSGIRAVAGRQYALSGIALGPIALGLAILVAKRLWRPARP